MVLAHGLLCAIAVISMQTNNHRQRTVAIDKFPIDNIQNLTALESLRIKLPRNRIQAIPKDVFRNLSHLRELDLSRNKLKHVEGLAFVGLESLVLLKLRRNDLIDLPDGAFYGLNNIQTLNLDYNNLSYVHKGWLYGLTSLKALTLDHNQINKIDGDSWEFCRSLTELHLTFNKLNVITKETFSRLNSLQYLYLDHNSISYIEESSFKSMSHLEVLTLNHNEIFWTVEDNTGAFVGLERLLHLSLSHNNIKSIAKRAFSGLTRLKKLDLSHNPIISIQDQSFSSFKQLQELHLNSVDLSCDCTLSWLSIWLHSLPQDEPNILNAKCKHPPWLMNKPLIEANIDDFKCEDFHKPYIIEEPKKDDAAITALKGNNMSIACKAASSSTSPMIFQWRKNNQLMNLLTSKNIQELLAQTRNDSITEYTSILKLQNVDDDDEGRYQCIATNSFGSVYSQRVRVNVHVMPVFTKKPANITVKAGNTARLECAAKGQPAPEIAWQKDSGNDFPAARERRMHVMPADDVFFIVEVKLSDMGTYSCTATNPAGAVMANATLEVLEMPTFEKPMLAEKETPAGETAVLECLTAGSPKPNLVWLKDDGPLIETERHFFTAENQLLIIVKTEFSDQGEYTCKMTNVLGTVQGSTILNIVEPVTLNLAKDLESSFLSDDTKIIEVIIIAVCICIVLTSLIWVIIIYRTRKQDEEYAQTKSEDSAVEDDELESTFTLKRNNFGVMKSDSVPNVYIHDTHSNYSDSSSKDSGTGDSAKGIG